MRLVFRSFGAAAVIAVASAFSVGAARAQATATVCKDGSPSATSGRGACSGHGGVDAAATKAAKMNAKAASKVAAKSNAAATGAGAMMNCTDGTMSKGGRGACSGHGGIKAAAVAPAPMMKPAPMAPMSKGSPAAAMGKAAPAPSSMARNSATGSGAKEDNNPAGAIAKCKDGLYSHSAHRQGACSRHGGVASWS